MAKEEVKQEATQEEVQTEAVVEEQSQEEEHFTKAGKHSKKAMEEAEAEEERKAKAVEKKDEEPVKKPKIVHTPNMKKRHGKAYVSSLAKVDRNARYNLDEAIKLAKETSSVKFDASLELHVNLGVDPRQADQMVRATVTLPHGTGKTIRVAVVDDDLITKIEKGQLDFDKLIATPAMMPKLAKLAKVLGPKGLMPSPKSGTVTDDVETALAEAKAGKVEFRIDKQAIVHQVVGKVSFDDAKLLENVKTLVSAIMKAKPSAAKGTYVKAMSLTSSMGPGIKLDATQAIKDAAQK